MDARRDEDVRLTSDDEMVPRRHPRDGRAGRTGLGRHAAKQVAGAQLGLVAAHELFADQFAILGDDADQPIVVFRMFANQLRQPKHLLL